MSILEQIMELPKRDQRRINKAIENMKRTANALIVVSPSHPQYPSLKYFADIAEEKTKSLARELGLRF